ncbi:alpha-galactosidase [Nonomuraea sp. NPDC050556]|uniref:alpha-galactosidase n=1 Tax=Nonomuraea sp. NPDC050556 TaxID=3364369 RepID=UPI0037875953
MSIIPIPGHENAWAAVTPHTSYVFSVEQGEEARVVQWYWGPRLPEAALGEVIRPRVLGIVTGFLDPGDIDEMLPVDGGRRWGVPSLQAVYEGGVRSVELAFDGAELTGDTIVITLRDVPYGLTVRMHLRVHGDSDVIERAVTVTNDADTPTTVQRLDSGSWVIPRQAGHRYLGAAGGWAAETNVHGGELPVGETTFTSRTGTTSHKANPWIMLGAATETHGQVWTVALAWSGSWRLTAQRRPEGDLAVTTGFGHEGPAWRLAPGESLRTPEALGLFTDGGYGEASRAWHDYARNHVLSHPDETRPVLYNSWEATAFDVTEEGQLDLARRAAALGAELFVVDDGWFGSRTDDRKGLGDWWPNPERFPDGLTRLFDGVRALGMQAGLWVEPEMVNPDSDLYRKNPDWVLHYPQRRRDTMRHQLVLNFARSDVQTWAVGWLDALVRDYGLAYLKWDMNRSFSQAGPDDLVWIEHTRGVYAVMDEVRRRNPEVRIESCSGGGGRVDFGMLRRTDQVWTSDNTDADDRQAIQHGYSMLYPAGAMSCWVTDSPNPITGRRVPLRYRFHVAMAGVLGVGGDLTEWTEDELREAAGHIAAYKEVRETVQHGRLHRLDRAVQYSLGDQVVVLAYDRDTPSARRVRLAGLDPDAVYVAGDGERRHGQTLMAYGLPFPKGPAGYRSELFVLRRTV